jgi:hypothetical protein
MTGHLGYDEGQRLAIRPETIGAAAMTPGPGGQAA